MHNLDAMAAFYPEVFGPVPFNRHQDEMPDRKIDEISCPARARRSAGTEAPALRDGKLVLEESRHVQLSSIAAGSGARVIAQ